MDVNPDLQQKHTYRVDRQPTTVMKNGVDCCAQDFSSQQSEIEEVASCKWTTSGAGTGDCCFTSYPLGWWDRANSSLQITRNGMLVEEWDNLKHGRRGLLFGWILTGWRDVLTESLQSCT